MPNLASAPGEVFFHVAKTSQSVDELIRSLYKQPSQATIDHFMAINSHLKDSRVRAGQMVVITPPNSNQCSRWEADLAEAARLVDEKLAKTSEVEARLIAENYQLLSNITSVGSNGVGAAMVYFSHHVKTIEGILKQINGLYVKTYNKTGTLNSQHFFRQRKILFSQLDRTLNSFIGEARMGYTLDQTHLKKSLGLNTKSLLHQWKRQPYPVKDVPGFAKNFAGVAKLSRTLKGIGYIGIGLDVGHSAVEIREACTVGEGKDCARTSFREGGRLTGSIIGGSGGGFIAAYGVCNMLFGLQTAGTSLLWCGIAVGIGGGYLGGKYVGYIGSELGNVIYEKTY